MKIGQFQIIKLLISSIYQHFSLFLQDKKIKKILPFLASFAQDKLKPSFVEILSFLISFLTLNKKENLTLSDPGRDNENPTTSDNF